MHHHLPNVKKSWFKITKKGRVQHCVATLIGCACLASSAMAADFIIDGAEVNSTQVLDTSGDTGTITNTGSIIVENGNGVEISYGNDFTLTNDGFITALGDAVDGVEGSWLRHTGITNSGTITATTDGYYGYAAGIHVDALTDSSTVINSGTITATANGYYGYVAGIQIDFLADSATIVNSGSITTTGNGYSTGIETVGILYDSSISNSGTISAIAHSSATGIRARFVYDNSFISNSGAISASADRRAIGIRADVLIYNSSINNSGTISATSERSATGISAGDVFFNSSISNSGTISATVDTSATDFTTLKGSIRDSSAATGIRTGYLAYNSSINNSGTISATADSSASGIRTGNLDYNSSISNSGTISAASVDGQATGISAGSMYSRKKAISSSLKSRYYSNSGITNNSSISNSGTINATTEYGQAIGISTKYIDNNSSISNSGTITTTAANGWAAGISGGYVYGFSSIRNSFISNTGTITATATNGIAAGIFFRDLFNSSISNDSTGNISITSDDVAIGINVDSLTGNSTISNDGIIRINDSGYVAVGIAGVNLDDHSSVTNSGTIEITNSYSGFSFYNAGIIVFNASANSAITNEGIINVTTDGSGLFDAGIFCKYGNGAIGNSGTITLTQDNPYGYLAAGILNLAGSTTIGNSGTIQALDSSGAISSENFSVFTQGGNLVNESTGVLKGRLHVGGDVDNQGSIYLPTPAATGYLPYLPGPAMVAYSSGASDYAGSLVNAGTISFTFQNDEDPADISYPTLEVRESAELLDGSTINVDIRSASHLMVGQTMEGVIQAAGITADFNEVNFTDNSALLVFTPAFVDDDTRLDLNIEGRTILEATSSSGKNGVLGTAGALDSLVDSDDPDIGDFIDNLYTYATDDEVAGDVIQVSPVNATTFPLVNYNLASTISDVVHSRQQSVTGFNSGDQMFSDRNLWIKPLGSRTDQDNRDGINGFDANSYGIGLGADGEYSDNGRLGLAFFYTNVDVDSNDVDQENDLDVFNLMAYGNNPLLNGSAELFYQLGGGLQDTDTSRHITSTGDTATADFTAGSLFARAKGAKTFQPTDKLQTMVGLGLAYTYYYNPSYHESGAGGLNLDVDSFDSNALVASLDGDLSYTLGTGVQLLANGSIGYDLIDDDTTVDADFQGASTVVFATEGIDNSPFIFKFGVGLGMDLKNNLSVDLKYNINGRASDYLNHAVTAQLNWNF